MAPRGALDAFLRRHRELIILLVVLPMSFITRTVRNVKRFFMRSRRDGHRERVARVAADVLRARERAERDGEGSAVVRTDRPGYASLSTRSAEKGRAPGVRVSDLNAVLKVNLGIGRAFVRVEPGILVGELVDFLENEGYMLESCIEMRDATLGGLIMSLGMTSHSHVAGLVHDSALAYELVTADGGLVRATPDNEHAELFRAIPWSHGTLGVLVAVDLRILPMLSHLKVTYHPTRSLQECHDMMRDLATNGSEAPYFLEAFVFSKERAIVVEADVASWREMSAPGAVVNNIGHWQKPWFYKHAESILQSTAPGVSVVEFVPTTAYLMRHNRSMCMTMDQICPQSHARWYRNLFGWLLPPDMQFLKKSRPTEERISAMREQVYQDYCVPSRNFPDLVNWLDANLDIYPLLVYPCKVIDRGGFVRLKSNRGKPIPRRVESSFYIDVGIFGRPKAIRNGNKRYPTISVIRELERQIRQWGGFQHTYCDVFATREEFEEMFDHTLWRQMRRKYNAEGVFPTIYEKLVPEVDIAPFLREEESWCQGEDAPLRPMQF